MTGGISQRDRVLNQRLDQQQQLSASTSSLLTALTTLQGSFAPASSSSTAGNIGTGITNFFDAYTQARIRSDQQSAAPANPLHGDHSGRRYFGYRSQPERATVLARPVGQYRYCAGKHASTTSLAQINQQIQSTSPSTRTPERSKTSDRPTSSQLSQLIGVHQIRSPAGKEWPTECRPRPGGQLLASAGSSFSDHLRSGRRCIALLSWNYRHHQRLGFRGRPVRRHSYRARPKHSHHSVLARPVSLRNRHQRQHRQQRRHRSGRR